MKQFVSLIYVYYNTPNELESSVKSIKNAVGNLEYQIIVIDNASPKPLPLKIKNNKAIITIENKENLGYGKAINQGASFAKGTFLLFINPDTEFKKDAIEKMVERMRKEKSVGVLGPQMLTKQGKILPTISGDPNLPLALIAFSFLNRVLKKTRLSEKYWLYNKDRKKEQYVDVVGGACMLMRSQIFEKVHGFDETFFMYFEEADICRRVRKLGLTVLYFPDAKIVHLIGRSSSNTEWIEKQFEKSRLSYFKKYHNFFVANTGELFLRLSKPKHAILIGIFLFSLFINLFKITTLMMFFGDFGRDYLAARDMLISHHIPLVGIQSSVIWLHQGPISVWLIALSLLAGKFHPVAPAVFYGTIGAFTTLFIYKLGNSFFTKRAGVFAALFFATSPLAVVNTRMPYHTSLIPFFTCLFFFMLWQILKGKRAFLFWLFFTYGVLLQVELSNGVLVFLFPVLLFFFRPKIKKQDTAISFLGSFLGALPFILYDTTHHFVQTLGFPLWILNRVRLFLGLTTQHNATTHNALNAFLTILAQLTSAVFPESSLIAFLIFLLIGFTLWKKRVNIKTNKGLTLLLLWFFVPIFGYIVHAAPSTAYFPVLFPAISLIIGYGFFEVIKKTKVSVVIFLLILFFNVYSLFHNDFYLSTIHHMQTIPPGKYNIGTTWTIYDSLAKSIVLDARGTSFQVVGGGSAGSIQTNFDNYRYLIIWRGGNLVGKSKTKYVIYQNKNDIKKTDQLIYKSKFGNVAKYETK